MGLGAIALANSRGLNSRELAFVAAVVSQHPDVNVTKAAIAAGYSEKTAHSLGSRLLKNVKVRAEIEERIRNRIEWAEQRAEITLDRTLGTIAKGAFFDPRNFFDANGHPKAIKDLDDVTAFAITGFEVATELAPGASDDDPPVRTIVRKVKLVDRNKAADMLMKHLNGYEADNKGKGAALAGAFGALMVAIEQRGSRLPLAEVVDIQPMAPAASQLLGAPGDDKEPGK